jgi:hypothetical protein
MPGGPARASSPGTATDHPNLGKTSFRRRRDFGDDWRHDIVVEKITLALPGVAYPRCTGGRGWAPVEDSGGIWAHNEAVAAAGLAMPFTPTALGALSKLANST